MTVSSSVPLPALPPWLAPFGSMHGIGGLVDHTLLRADATRGEIVRLCEEAMAHRLAAVCVNGSWVHLASRSVAGSGVKVAAAVGFPLGAMTLAAKAAEVRLAIADGADELDAVMAIGPARSGDWWAIEDELQILVEVADGRPLKVILETAVLSPDEIIRACQIAAMAGARAVKTSTGFHPAGGARVEAVELMRRTVGVSLGVKASGGIRTCTDAIRMLAAGADRLGTSHALAMLDCVGGAAPPLGELLPAAWSS